MESLWDPNTCSTSVNQTILSGPVLKIDKQDRILGGQHRAVSIFLNNIFQLQPAVVLGNSIVLDHWLSLPLWLVSEWLLSVCCFTLEEWRDT